MGLIRDMRAAADAGAPNAAELRAAADTLERSVDRFYAAERMIPIGELHQAFRAARAVYQGLGR